MWAIPLHNLLQRSDGLSVCLQNDRTDRHVVLGKLRSIQRTTAGLIRFHAISHATDLSLTAILLPGWFSEDVYWHYARYGFLPASSFIYRYFITFLASCNQVAVCRLLLVIFDLIWFLSQAIVYICTVHSMRFRCLTAGTQSDTALTGSRPVYRVGQKSKLLLLCKYVNKTEKIGGTRTSTNYKQLQRKWSIVWYFHVNILRHNCFVFKYSTTESSQWNYC